MSRILILAVVGVLLLGAPLAADQMLQNPDVRANNSSDLADQQQFVETSGSFVGVAPILLAALVVGAMLVAVRAVGGP